MDSSKAEKLPGVRAIIRYDAPDLDLHDYFPREIELVLVEGFHSPGYR
jgi:hypothetical protein